MMFVFLALETDLMLHHVIAQMVNGITTMFVKIVTTNVNFVTIVLLIVVVKVNVLKIDLTHQFVIVLLDTMMMDTMPNVMFVTVNVPIVQKPDVLLVQELEHQLLIVTVQLDISNPSL